MKTLNELIVLLGSFENAVKFEFRFTQELRFRTNLVKDPRIVTVEHTPDLVNALFDDLENRWFVWFKDKLSAFNHFSVLDRFTEEELKSAFHDWAPRASFERIFLKKWNAVALPVAKEEE